MHFGIFIEEMRRGSSAPDWFQETFDLVDAAEAWGLDGVWLGEIHFNLVRSVLSSPTALAGFLAARTRRVRIGTAITVLPLGNPLRIAEDEEILQTRVAFGAAPALIDRLGELRDDLGLTGIVAELNPGGLLPVERMQRTLRILTREVIPAFR